MNVFFPVRKHYFLVILTFLKGPETTRKGAKTSKVVLRQQGFNNCTQLTVKLTSEIT